MENEGRTFIVSITEEDIKNGTERNAKSCPVARALSRATRCDNVVAGTGYLFFTEEGVSWKAATPKHVQNFMDGFDRLPGHDQDVFPFEFVAHFRNPFQKEV